jgi:hypothetical protein
MFAVMPVVILPALWVAAILVFVMGTSAFEWISGGKPDPGFVNSVLPAVVVTMILGPIALSAVLFCHLALKAGVSWKWSAVACGLLAALAFTVFGDVIAAGQNRSALHGVRITSVEPPIEANERNRLTFGLGLRTNPSVLQIAQMLIPLAVLGWAVARQSRQQKLATS